MYSITTFLKKHWSAMLAGAGVALVIASLAVLTTKTDAITTAGSESVAAVETSREVVFVKGDLVSRTSDEASATAADNSSNTVSSTDTIDNSSQNESDPFAVTIAAQTAIVWDVKNNTVLFDKESQKEVPLASLTKLMTALVGAQLAKETESMETVISRQHLNALGSNGLVADQTWDIYDLISFMLIESSNDAARAVAAASSPDQADGYAKDFVERMNATARSLGLESTYFFNPSGLDLNEKLISGGYGSARDTAELFSYILQTNSQILSPTTRSQEVFYSQEGVSYPATNTNTWLGQFPETLGSKTGYTVLAGGNLVMAFDLKRPIVIVVLGSTQLGRFEDMKTLYQASKQYLSKEVFDDFDNVITD
jgi:D-alanyl-D-alanine carboxypeptidase (penicillin-binding protein 5/6)